MKRYLLSILSATVMALPTPVVAAGETKCINCFDQRYVYFGANFDYVAYFDTLKDVIVAAKAAGYNGIALASSGSGSYTSITQYSKPIAEQRYRDIATWAAAHGMEIIPVGAGPDVAATLDPTLVEAFPVVSQTFSVTGSSATVPSVELLTNTSFETTTTATPPGAQDWLLLDPGITRNATIGHSGTASIQFNQAPPGPTAMARLYRPISNLKPHTAYRLSFWLKTDNYNGNLRVQIYDGTGSQPLFYNVSSGLGWGVGPDGSKNAQPNSIATTQEWQQYNLDFNTLSNTSIRLYLGTWANGTLSGSAWADDFSLKEVGLARSVRRSSLPIQVISADGAVTYVEGSDYLIGAEKLQIPTGSRIHSGNALKVQWWQSSSGVESNWGAPASICSAAYFDAQKLVAQKVNDIFQADNFFVYIDEWRVANWDPACGGSMTAAQYFGTAMSSTATALRTVNPNYQFITWSDMFDPYHNAKPAYWMVNGSLAVGSTSSYLPLGTTVMNWNMQGVSTARDSLLYFSNVGVQQMIALYYDDTSLTNIDNWLEALNQAQALGARRIKGFMYTTWIGNAGYANLAAVANRIKTLAPGRWPLEVPTSPLEKRRAAR